MERFYKYFGEADILWFRLTQSINSEYPKREMVLRILSLLKKACDMWVTPTPETSLYLIDYDCQSSITHIIHCVWYYVVNSAEMFTLVDTVSPWLCSVYHFFANMVISPTQDDVWYSYRLAHGVQCRAYTILTSTDVDILPDVIILLHWIQALTRCEHHPILEECYHRVQLYLDLIWMNLLNVRALTTELKTSLELSIHMLNQKDSSILWTNNSETYSVVTSHETIRQVKLVHNSPLACYSNDIQCAMPFNTYDSAGHAEAAHFQTVQMDQTPVSNIHTNCKNIKANSDGSNDAAAAVTCPDDAEAYRRHSEGLSSGVLRSTTVALDETTETDVSHLRKGSVDSSETNASTLTAAGTNKMEHGSKEVPSRDLHASLLLSKKADVITEESITRQIVNPPGVPKEIVSVWTLKNKLPIIMQPSTMIKSRVPTNVVCPKTHHSDQSQNQASIIVQPCSTTLLTKMEIVPTMEDVANPWVKVSKGRKGSLTSMCSRARKKTSVLTSIDSLPRSSGPASIAVVDVVPESNIETSVSQFHKIEPTEDAIATELTKTTTKCKINTNKKSYIYTCDYDKVLHINGVKHNHKNQRQYLRCCASSHVMTPFDVAFSYFMHLKSRGTASETNILVEPQISIQIVANRLGGIPLSKNSVSCSNHSECNTEIIVTVAALLVIKQLCYSSLAQDKTLIAIWNQLEIVVQKGSTSQIATCMKVILSLTQQHGLSKFVTSHIISKLDAVSFGDRIKLGQLLQKSWSCLDTKCKKANCMLRWCRLLLLSLRRLYNLTFVDSLGSL